LHKLYSTTSHIPQLQRCCSSHRQRVCKTQTVDLCIVQLVKKRGRCGRNHNSDLNSNLNPILPIARSTNLLSALTRGHSTSLLQTIMLNHISNCQLSAYLANANTIQNALPDSIYNYTRLTEMDKRSLYCPHSKLGNCYTVRPIPNPNPIPNVGIVKRTFTNSVIPAYKRKRLSSHETGE